MGRIAGLTGTAPGLSKDMAPKANTASPDFEWYVDRTVPQESWSTSQSASASVAFDRFPIKWFLIVQIVNAEFSTIDERLQRLAPCDIRCTSQCESFWRKVLRIVKGEVAIATKEF